MLTGKLLDRKEGYPRHYDRKEPDVDLDDGTSVKEWVYIARPPSDDNTRID